MRPGLIALLACAAAVTVSAQATHDDAGVGAIAYVTSEYALKARTGGARRSTAVAWRHWSW